jgi:hypothetical protein
MLPLLLHSSPQPQPPQNRLLANAAKLKPHKLPLPLLRQLVPCHSMRKPSVWPKSYVWPMTSCYVAHRLPSHPKWRKLHKSTLRSSAPWPKPSRRWTNRALVWRTIARRWRTSTALSRLLTRPTTSTSKASASRWALLNKSMTRHASWPNALKNSMPSMAA